MMKLDEFAIYTFDSNPFDPPVDRSSSQDGQAILKS